MTQNTARFPVTADDPFSVEVPMQASAASSGSGYVALIFLDAQGKGVLRLRLPFEPVEQPVATVTTDEEGRFSLAPTQEAKRGAVGFHAEFRGDQQHRAAEARVP